MVQRVVKHAFVDVKGPHVSIYWPDIGRCSGEWSVTPTSVVVTISSADRPPNDCLAVGTHTFHLVNGALVEH